MMEKAEPNFTQWVIALAAVGALGVSIYNASRIETVAGKVETVHISINSRMSELLELTQKSSRAEGVKEEKDRVQIPH